MEFLNTQHPEILRVADVAGMAPNAVAVQVLTARELQIAGLLALRVTNRQIGERLIVSDRTVGTHVQNILGKRGFSSRAQVAAWVAMHNLLGDNPATISD